MSLLNQCLDTYKDFQTLLPEQLPTSESTDYSDIDSHIDKVIINNILSSVFNKNAYSAQSRSIVTDYLGYTSCGSPSSRFITLIKKINDLISKSNLNKPKNIKAAVILQTINDESEAFNSTAILPQIEQLAKTHYIAFKLVGFQGKTLGKAISDVALELGDQRPIMTLIVRAHGDQNSIELGRSNVYSTDCVNAKDFKHLNKKATIIFSACSTGFNLARKVAYETQRFVFAYMKPSTDDFITACCDSHGYGAIAFDEDRNQIARRFTNNRSYVSESNPCTAKHSEIKKIKKALLNDKILAANSGDAAAQNDLGSYYYKGHDVSQSYEEATKWYEKAAIQGFSNAQYNLALCYAKGEGVPQAYKIAAMWYQKASEQGHAKAQYNLANLYYLGLNVPKSYYKAAKLYEEAASQGHIDAQYNLGLCYAKGEGVTVSNETAVMWYQKAAQKDHADAQYNLGLCCAKGEGIDKSNKAAAMWYQKAAEQGNADAQYNLGLCYTKGDGVTKSKETALMWLQKAAEQKHEKAKSFLNSHCTKGRDILQSHENVFFPVTDFTLHIDENFTPKSSNVRVVFSSKTDSVKPKSTEPTAQTDLRSKLVSEQSAIKDVLQAFAAEPRTPRKAVISLAKLQKDPKAQSLGPRRKSAEGKENLDPDSAPELPRQKSDITSLAEALQTLS